MPQKFRAKVITKPKTTFKRKQTMLLAIFVTHSGTNLKIYKYIGVALSCQVILINLDALLEETHINVSLFRVCLTYNVNTP